MRFGLIIAAVFITGLLMFKRGQDDNTSGRFVFRPQHEIMDKIGSSFMSLIVSFFTLMVAITVSSSRTGDFSFDMSPVPYFFPPIIIALVAETARTHQGAMLATYFIPFQAAFTSSSAEEFSGKVKTGYFILGISWAAGFLILDAIRRDRKLKNTKPNDEPNSSV